jgi:AcrR family transcriptional regulator
MGRKVKGGSVPSGSQPAARRRYDASGRRRTATQTRARIVNAARERFLADGYSATTIAAIASRAEVAPDTIYATVGPKPALFREVVETALSGTEQPVAGRDRDYAVRMRAEPDVRTKLAIYAAAVAQIQQRLAPLFLVLREAAAGHDELGQLWQEITHRRAVNMRLLAADLASTNKLRQDLSLDEIADIIWTMNSSEYYALLVIERGWSPERYETWLCDAWTRLLLPTPPSHSADVRRSKR